MFWNVTFIYNAFIRTTDHCKVQTAFVSLFYIFINMKPRNASNSSIVVGRPRPLGHLTNFCTNFFNFGQFVKIRDFFCWGNEFSIYVCMCIIVQSTVPVVEPSVAVIVEWCVGAAPSCSPSFQLGRGRVTNWQFTIRVNWQAICYTDESATVHQHDSYWSWPVLTTGLPQQHRVQRRHSTHSAPT